MNVVWTKDAVGQLAAIGQRLTSIAGSEASSRLLEGILDRGNQIADFPLSGRRVPEFDFTQVREVIQREYRILYHILPDRIEILAVVHGSMDLGSIPSSFT